MLEDGFKKKLKELPAATLRRIENESEIMKAQPWDNSPKQKNEASAAYIEAKWFSPDNKDYVLGWADELIKRYPNSSLPLIRKSQLLIERGEFEDAINTLVQGFKRDKFNPKLAMMISSDYLLCGDYENALEYGLLYTRMLKVMSDLEHDGFFAERDIIFI